MGHRRYGHQAMKQAHKRNWVRVLIDAVHILYRPVYRAAKIILITVDDGTGWTSIVIDGGTLKREKSN